MGRRCVAVSLLLLLLLGGCGRQSGAAPRENTQPVSASFFAMDTAMEVTLWGDAALLEQAEEQVGRLEKLFSVTEEGSEIRTLNGTGAAEISPDTRTLVSAGLELCRRTEGALDLSIYPVLKAWGFTTGEYRIPEEDELRELLTRVGWERISLDSDLLRVEPGMEMDLGSVAKGYTGDTLIRLFREAGVTSALLNLGGNVQTLGRKPDGSPWRIGVQNPGKDDVLGVLKVSDRAVITSGGYERYFVEDGQTWWHILDPETGCPARSGLTSVTVVGEEGVVCDGLSTALFVMGLERGTALWRESRDFEAIFVTEDGTVHLTEGLAGDFTPAQGLSLNMEVISRA